MYNNIHCIYIYITKLSYFDIWGHSYLQQSQLVSKVTNNLIQYYFSEVKTNSHNVILDENVEWKNKYKNC